MVLTALRGAVGFLTRLPVGTDEAAWTALCGWVPALVLAAYPIGLAVGVPLVVPLPDPTAAVLYVLAVVAVTGINHADGLADLGDAAAVHGGPQRRRSVMRDTTVGVGAVVAVAIGLGGLALGGLGLAAMPWRLALSVAVGAEVGAKLSMATLAALGRASHEGLGAQLLGAGRGDLLLSGLAAAPATALSLPALSGVVAVAAGPAVALALRAWAHARLGGVGGDVFGAANELARLGAVHAGVIAWTLS